MYHLIYSAEGEDFIIHDKDTYNWQPLIIILLTATSILLLLQLAISIIKIYRLKKVYPLSKFSEFDFIQTDLQSAPFSFFKNIFWRNDIDMNTHDGKQILQHEITHIKQKHSLDKICMQLVLCFYWINPFFWWLKKELYLIHEFIADEKAIGNNNAASFAQMLLAAKYGKFEFLPAQSIFYSSIKRRLIMLTTSKKTQFSYLRRVMVLPLIAAVVCLSAFSIKNQNKASSLQKIKAAKPFVLVVDAGHGGKDFGTVDDDLNEKDLSLKISKEIKKLSPEYNIDVILTRNNDVYMSPHEKVNFVNAQNADAFISVHINASTKDQPMRSGMEVILSKRNSDVLSNSEVLGSAIIQNLQTDFTVAPVLMQRDVGIWVLDQSKIPCTLIECGYMTNPADVKLLKQNANIELIAKNILQGVTMYANNKVDKSKLYKIQDQNKTDTNAPLKSSSMQMQPMPLYVIDGKIVDQSAADKQTHDPNNILSVDVLKGPMATNKYGDKGNNGVIEVTLKHNNLRQMETDTSTKPIFTSAQKEPEFPGGLNGWQKFLEANLNANIPAKKHAPKGIYTVTLSFLIDENGKVSEVKTLKDPGYGTAEEAVRVISKGPDWIPAVQNGQKVVYKEKQNISFSVD